MRVYAKTKWKQSQTLFVAQAVNFVPIHQSSLLLLVLGIGIGRWRAQYGIEGSAGVAARLWSVDWCSWRCDAGWQR